MRNFIELSLDSLKSFPIKEKKGMLPVEPDLVFDFYMFPKVFVINDLVDKLSPYLKSNVELQDGAVELKHSDLRANYSYLYVIEPNTVESVSDDVHIFRNEENSSLFFSEELINEINKLPMDYILYRWNK
ncbi:hypothetical protein MHO82_25595 [Vibrio sp. Of7-15]|uniref:hypothetical protein n=1 Tax=Vibrio sp. Of7-15 TaxID=2724879 RepID=UPI001EF2F7D1|nr:hypothetical protein [Vibrio sp. Of7-15]MCG7500226.1 hypothetical protein [Vibrio sp. Of7-15]